MKFDLINQKYELIGVASRGGNKCEKKKRRYYKIPDVYTRISSYLPWINYWITKWTSNPGFKQELIDFSEHSYIP